MRGENITETHIQSDRILIETLKFDKLYKEKIRIILPATIHALFPC